MKSLILILGLLTAFGPLSIDMYLPALSAIAQEFNSPISSIQFSLSSFFIGLAIGQIFYGPITDRFGRKKPLYIGLVIYIGASILCAQAQSPYELAVYRFIQALGSCAGMVISKAVVRDRFEPRDAAKTFSLLMLIMGIAPILAPALGGQMLQWASWRAIFYFLAVSSAITLALVFFILPETHKAEEKTRLRDTFSIFAEILKDRNFIGYSLACSIAYGGMFAYITGSAFVFIEYFGFSPSAYSILFGVNASGIILFSQVNGLALRKHMPAQILKTLFPTSAFLGLCLLLCGLYLPSKYAIIPCLWAFLASMGMMFPNSTACALAAQKRAGSASALMGTIQFSASALISAAVSFFHNETLVPMTSIVGICAIGAYGAYKLIVPKT